MTQATVTSPTIRSSTSKITSKRSFEEVRQKLEGTELLLITSHDWSQSRAPHSGSPAFRNPSAKVARSSGRRIGSRSARLETRSVGSSYAQMLHRALRLVRPARQRMARRDDTDDH